MKRSTRKKALPPAGSLPVYRLSNAARKLEAGNLVDITQWLQCDMGWTGLAGLIRIFHFLGQPTSFCHPHLDLLLPLVWDLLINRIRWANQALHPH